MTWPSVVWDAAVLRGLDPRGRADIGAAGSVRAMAAGDLVYSPGDPADALFVIVEGVVAIQGHGGALTREVGRGESFGEEAMHPRAAVRTCSATCREPGRVAVIPAAVLRRALGRLGAGGVAARVERALARAAARDALLHAAPGAALPREEIDLLLDAAEPWELGRGEVLYRAGDPADTVLLVAGGVLVISSEGGRGDARHGYAAFGELLTDATPHRAHTVVASGAAWGLAFPRAMFERRMAKYPAWGRALSNAAAERQRVRDEAARRTSARGSLLEDPHRVDTARSLLVIDRAACVRCGACEEACGRAHADGVVRLARQGDTLVARLSGEPVALLVADACQHCASPSCLPVCPTGAIEHSASGTVRVREALCIGCGACTKACPWDNLQLVAGRRPSAAAIADRKVAVKCDLCRGLETGPACVRACPVNAIARVDPAQGLPELAALVRGRVAAGNGRWRAPTSPTWPWLVGVVPLGLALALRGGGWSPLSTGSLAGGAMIALAAYAVIKRRRGPATRRHFVAHVALGELAMAAVLAHTHARVGRGVAGGLHLAFWGAALVGVVWALAYRLVPARIARLEGGGRASDGDGAQDDVFRALSGASEGVKALYARLLRPYARSAFGPLWLVVRGATPAEEEQALERRIDSMLAGRESASRAAVRALVTLAVRERAARARRGLEAILRAGLPAHVAGAAIALVLLVIHVVTVLRRP